MLASNPVPTLNQQKADLGIPRDSLKPHPALVTPPPAPVIVERLANGGLLMSATTQTFDVENPAHMAAAREIAAAIAPLNALP